MRPTIHIMSADNMSPAQGVQQGRRNRTPGTKRQAVLCLFQRREGRLETFPRIVPRARVLELGGPDLGLRERGAEADGWDDRICRRVRVTSRVDRRGGKAEFAPDGDVAA